ncbi:proton pump-interactor 1-like [Dorcoceras hygrometricum]|uniref:Proton pump-interactor 1-like n=1 Tax=Dorcoceras hygrometricum TaxID=472368 RepID=A0A2Z7AMC5_9LAMI|nr:proton pump-interactor 1-like [Dorcoceras hygrometricum]
MAESTCPKSYVVFVGREPGVYDKWSEASKQVCGFRGTCYKGYETNKEAEEAFRSFVQEPDATRFREKCECSKTSTASTSRPHRGKNSQKLVKVLRDLAVEIHNHAARMEKVVEEIGEKLDDMQVTFHGAVFGTHESLFDCIFSRVSKMSVASKMGSEEIVTSKYVVPLIDLSSDDEERHNGEAKSCDRKTKVGNMGLHSPVRIPNVKRMKFSDDTKTPLKTTEMKNLTAKVNTDDGQKRCGPSAAIIIDISDDSSG